MESARSALPVVGRVYGDEEAFGENCSAPRTATEYLLRVRAEAERIPDVMVASDVDERADDEEAERGEEENCDLTPPEDWERCVLGDLCEARVALGTLAGRGFGSKEFGRIPLPRMKDSEGWEEFCDSHLPLAKLVLQFDAVMTQAVLSHHVDWLEDETKTTTLLRPRALWLYALLAHLQKPVHRDTQAIIRRLILRLFKLRAERRRHTPTDEGDDDDEFQLIQILIVVAGRFFGQASREEINGVVVPDALLLKNNATEMLSDDDDDDDNSFILERTE